MKTDVAVNPQDIHGNVIEVGDVITWITSGAELLVLEIKTRWIARDCYHEYVVLDIKYNAKRSISPFNSQILLTLKGK